MHNSTIVPTTTKRTTVSISTTHRSVFQTPAVNELTSITEKTKSLLKENSTVEDEEDTTETNSSTRSTLSAFSILSIAFAYLCIINFFMI
jgi:hypothetical protein